MLPAPSSSIRLFRFAGIEVSLHWWWFVVAVFEIAYRSRAYGSIVWNIAEYLGLFVIVLMHEFGHSLACRSVGGEADHIVLWPFGGVAFVNPPQRPGAQLWSIAAGPLVNVVLLPILFGLAAYSSRTGLGGRDVQAFFWALLVINCVLLGFNLMPVYPLDGGQIVRSLLWFFIGRARSLKVASLIGFFGIAALLVYAIYRESLWLGIMVFFLGQQCLVGYRQAQALHAIAKLPRHPDFKCPSCGAHPPAAPLWVCGNCHHRFDAFATRGVCPHCQATLLTPAFTCVDCGHKAPLTAWDTQPHRPPGAPPIIDI